MAAGSDAVAPTVIVSRRVAEGREEEYRRWAEHISAVAATFPGHLGAELQPPGPAHPAEWVIVYRFATQEQLEVWLASERRAALVADAEPLIVGAPVEHRIARPQSVEAAATAVISQRVPDGSLEEFRRCQVELALVMSRFPGFLHSEVIEPVPGVQDDHVVAITFEDRAALDRWLGSPERAEAVRTIESLVQGDRSISVVDGFAGWFTELPGKAPKRYKQATAVLLALFPTSLALSFLFRSVDHGLPWPAVVFASNVLGIVALTWVLMPRVTRALSGWLHS